MAQQSDLVQEAPASIVHAVETASRMQGQRILLSTSTSEWVAVVGATGVIRELAIAEAKNFRVYGAVGSGFLQALVDGAWIDLVRY